MSARNTITDALRTNGLSHYARHAEPVISAVEAREQEIVGNLMSYATSQGLSEAQARGALAEAGLSVPEPQAAAQAAEESTAAAALGRIESTVNSLVSFARRHGFNG